MDGYHTPFVGACRELNLLSEEEGVKGFLQMKVVSGSSTPRMHPTWEELWRGSSG